MSGLSMRRAVGGAGAFSVLVAGLATAVSGPAVAATSGARARARARAPRIASVYRCYRNVDSTVAGTEFRGSGWPAGDTVALTNRHYRISLRARVTAGGRLAVAGKAPRITLRGPGQRRIALTATDTRTHRTATTSFYVTKLEAAITPSRAKPDQTVTWSFSGFDPGRPIFGHFIYDGRQAALADYGTAKGPCGTLTARQKIFPGGHPREREYMLQIDVARRYSSRTQPAIFSTFTLGG